MVNLLKIDNDELSKIINIAAEKKGMSNAIIEKDFWVCTMLNYLFNDFEYKNKLCFKGGTSLSKAYHLIERFSEDIDLILDWSVIGYSNETVYEDRSNSKQVEFNETANQKAQVFLVSKMIPILKRDFKALLSNNYHYDFYIDKTNSQTICFEYPKKNNDKSILQIIRLEIGPIAEPLPLTKINITPYICEINPGKFENENISVKTMKSIRTFFEKITILHREANRTNKKYPTRYSRHYYDVYKMLNSELKDESFDSLDILKKVIEFKTKFYHDGYSNLAEILNGNLKLIPNDEAIKAFTADYESMKNMIFGEKVTFPEILKTLQIYQDDFNKRTPDILKEILKS